MCSRCESSPTLHEANASTDQKRIKHPSGDSCHTLGTAMIYNCRILSLRLDIDRLEQAQNAFGTRSRADREHKRNQSRSCPNKNLVGVFLIDAGKCGGCEMFMMHINLD
jgi:hypothetical protein